MFGTHDLALFMLAGLLLNVTPGPDTLYISGRSLQQGWRAGAMASLGVGAGCLIHTTAAAIGLSALIAASATAFTAIKILGAAYLIYMGIDLMHAPAPSGTERGRPAVPAGLWRAFAHGCLTNALNPKVALFFLAFLPQFVTPGAPNKALAFLFLGLLFNLTGTLWNLGVAITVARLGSGWQRHRLRIWLGRLLGGLLVLVGVRLIFVVPR